MPKPLDLTFDVGDDGTMPRGTARLIARNVAGRAGHRARIRVTLPLRTPVQNDAYHLFLGWVSKEYHDAGADYSAALLHRWYKLRFLPIVAATLLQETGEIVEYRRVDTFPDGREEEREYTTTRLSKAAFSLYVQLILADDEVASFGLPFPSVDGMRTGGIHEPEELS